MKVELKITLNNGETLHLTEEYDRSQMIFHGLKFIEDNDFGLDDVKKIHFIEVGIEGVNLNNFPNLRAVTFDDGVAFKYFICEHNNSLKEVTLPCVKEWARFNVRTEIHDLTGFLQRNPNVNIRFMEPVV